MNPNTIFYTALVGAIVSAKLPIIGKFFRVANTFVHESGHALASLLTSGEVISIKLSYNTSGTATTRSKYFLSRLLTSLAGYITSSVSAFACFYLIKHHRTDMVIYGIAALAVINLIFWVRNSFGVIWLVLFCLLLAGIIYLKNPQVTQFSSIFLATILLLESVTSAFVIFYLGFSSPQNSGDAKNLKDQTYIPSFIWGILFLAQALYFAYMTIGLYYKIPFL